jgi:hypothetical protein
MGAALVEHGRAVVRNDRKTRSRFAGAYRRSHIDAFVDQKAQHCFASVARRHSGNRSTYAHAGQSANNIHSLSSAPDVGGGAAVYSPDC